MRTVIFVVKNVWMTRFMQDADMFERFKFLGTHLETKQADTHFHLSAKQLLDRAVQGNNEQYETVGVIIPDVGAAFVPNHKVYSNGVGWVTIWDMCETCNAPLHEDAA